MNSSCFAILARGFGVLAVAAVSHLPEAALAADADGRYPERAIRMIVPSTSGGVTDIAARAVGDVMREVFGQPVVIENRPGAGGRLGAEIAAKAQPDGYTLFVANGSAFSIAMAMEKNLPYDVLRDFDSVALLSELPGTLAVHRAVPAKSVTELVAYAKERPGKVSLGTSGVGSGGHIVSLRLAARAGIELVHVPYKGEAQALLDAAAGHIPVVIGSAVKNFVDGGQLRPIASLGRTRSVQFPELPTMIEQGYAGVFQVSWNAVSVPRGTPTVIALRLNKVINTALQTLRVRKILLDNGFSITGGDTSVMAAWVKSEIARYRQVVAEFNLRTN